MDELNSQSLFESFPLLVLIGDEQCFQEVLDVRQLNGFEEPDIKELTHWAWDLSGRKYKLVWSKRQGIIPEFVSENGVAEFRAAVHALQARGAKRPSWFAARRCSLEELQTALRTMEGKR